MYSSSFISGIGLPLNFTSLVALTAKVCGSRKKILVVPSERISSFPFEASPHPSRGLYNSPRNLKVFISYTKHLCSCQVRIYRRPLCTQEPSTKYLASKFRRRKSLPLFKSTFRNEEEPYCPQLSYNWPL